MSARGWGNKPIQIYLSAGSPGNMVERLIFSGRTYDKPTSDTSNQSAQTIGTWKAVDDSILSGAEAFCYEQQPYSGLLRGAISRDWAARAGDRIDECPAGTPVNLPIILNNARFIDELKKLWAPEGCFVSRNAAGGIVIKQLQLNPRRTTLDESGGDWLLGSWNETPPEMPGVRYYARGFLPVGNEALPFEIIDTTTRVEGTQGVTTTRTITEFINGNEVLYIQNVYGPLTLPVVDATQDAVTDGTDSNGHTRYKHAGGTSPTPTTQLDQPLSGIVRISNYDSDWNLQSQSTRVMGWYHPRTGFAYLLTSESPEINGAAPRARIGALGSGRVYTDGTAGAPFEFTTVSFSLTTYSLVPNPVDGDTNFTLDQVTQTYGYGAPEMAAPQDISTYLKLANTTSPVETAYYAAGTTPNIGYTAGVVYDYGNNDWRSVSGESYGLVSEVSVTTTVADGIVIAVETDTKKYFSSVVASGYLYGDGTQRADLYYTYDTALIVVDEYEAQDDGTFLKTTETNDIENSTETVSDPSTVTPPEPMWPESALTQFQTIPTVINYTDPDLSASFAPSVVVVDATYCETVDQMRAAIAMEARRETAIVRSVIRQCDLSLQMGDTIGLKRLRPDSSGTLVGVNSDHFVTGIDTQHTFLTGAQYDTITAEHWTR